MKRIAVVCLVLAMTATLIACGDGGSTTSTSTSAPSPGTSELPPQVVAPPPAPEALPDIDAGFEVPFVDFGTDRLDDPWARDPYQLVYLIAFHSPFSRAMVETYIKIGERLNFTMESFDTNRDYDLLMNLIETCAGQDYDAMIIEGDYTIMDRIFEIVNEYDITFIPGLSPYIDAPTGRYRMASTVVDSYARGYMCMNYLLDNFMDLSSVDFDWDEVGIATIEYSVISDFNERVAGAEAALRERYPDLMASNYFPLDTAAEATVISAEAGYNVVAATISANPQYKGWIIHSVVEDMADGGSRALEDLGYGSVSLVTSDSITILRPKWDAGYEGAWVAGVDTPQIQWAHAQITGLLLMLEGKETPETLWPNLRGAGQDYTVIRLPFTMVERHTYVDYIAAVDRYIDLHFPSPR